MIYDTLENLPKYKGLYDNLDKAIDYLMSNDLHQLQAGRYDILGNDIYVNVVETVLQTEENCMYELHQQYLDLHINLNDMEMVQFAEYIDSNITKPYEEEGDYALLTGDKRASCLVDEKHFVICMLGEPHMPCVKVNECTDIKKAIVKVRV